SEISNDDSHDVVANRNASLARVAAESRFLDEKPRSRARPLQFGSITTEHEDNAMIDQENQFTTIETDQLNRVIGGAGVFEDNLEPAGRAGGAALGGRFGGALGATVGGWLGGKAGKYAGRFMDYVHSPEGKHIKDAAE